MNGFTAIRTFAATATESAPSAATIYSSGFARPKQFYSLRFLSQALTLAGSPTGVNLRVWVVSGGSKTVQTNAQVTLYGTLSATVVGTQAYFNPLDLQQLPNDAYAYVTVDFVGGTSPTATGTAFVQPLNQ